MRILRARYRSGDEFLRHYQPSFLHGGIFYPTREQKISLGEAVVVEISFPELRNRVMLRGFVAWRRAGRHRTKLRAGLGVEFLAADRYKRNYLLSVAKGEVVDLAQRRHRRLPVELRVDWRVKEAKGSFSSLLDDIGPGGAFIRTTDFLPPGTEIILDVLPPGSIIPLSVAGRVAWTRHTSGEEGVGVEFKARDAGGIRRLRELVRRLESLEVLPEPASAEKVS
jgi:Tfp pilus assembly protein PilZ